MVATRLTFKQTMFRLSLFLLAVATTAAQTDPQRIFSSKVEILVRSVGQWSHPPWHSLVHSLFGYYSLRKV
jgi:hypothetical protein